MDQNFTAATAQVGAAFENPSEQIRRKAQRGGVFIAGLEMTAIQRQGATKENNSPTQDGLRE
jgi:hypothetical protein